MKLQFTNIFRTDETNIGDSYSTPTKYFDLPGNQKDIFKLEYDYTPPHENVIYGGGGLIGQMRPMSHVLRHQKSSNYRIYGWGLGEHMYICLDEQVQCIPPMNITYPGYIRSFDLLGIRDHHPHIYQAIPTARWVPCASCMHEAFDKEYKVKYDVVFFTHSTLPMNVIHGMPPETWDYPHKGNNEINFEETIEFIASGDIVVTNSYHGAYWATLLGKVVVVFPWCSKFYGLKHKPLYCPTTDWWKTIQDREQRQYKSSLGECREANINFHKELKEHILNSPRIFKIEV